MNKSAVIIGGGIGGLFTGAILSHEGLDVTIIEKNNTIGGGLQSFSRFGEVFDAGMHIIGGMYENGSVREVCKYIGILDKMNIRPVDDDCIDEIYFGANKKNYRIAKGRDGFIRSISNYFPNQRCNIHRYVEAMFEMTNELDLFYLRPATSNLFMHSPDFLMPVGDFIKKYIDDEKLQSLLAYMNPLYAGHESSTPAYIHSVINVLYINGASRFVDGSYHFAEEMQKLIEQKGGKVVLNDAVTKISTKEREISNIETKSGKKFIADYYICAMHPCSLFGLLDDEKALSKSYHTRLQAIPNTYSAFTLYIKLKQKRIKYINHISYYIDEYSDMWHFDEMDHRWPHGLMYMTPPEKNQGEYSTKMLVTTPMTWNCVKQWEDTTVGKRGASYVAWKKDCAIKMLHKMTMIYHDILDCIEDVNMASPLTIRDYYNVKEGSMYGFQKDCDNITLSQVPVVTKTKNLFLTGQNNHLHGFCGVVLTSINTCEAILGKNYIINKINENNRL